MSYIKTKDFGPVKSEFTENNGFFNICKVTVFIRNQGTNKSSIAKLISTNLNRFAVPLLTKATGFWVLLLLFGATAIAQAQTQGRWLEIKRLGGTVFYKTPTQQAAQIGDRLEKPGQGIDTGVKSYSILRLDSDIGTVNVGEKTNLLLKETTITPNQGRVTILSVPKGTARLRIRKFTNPESRLEIETPAGITGVRGTEFTVGVDTKGTTVLATKEGTISAIAQGEAVLVQPGYGTRIIPGEPPDLPQLLSNDIQLQSIRLFRTSLGTVEVQGQVDSLNLVWLNGESVTVNKQGKFKAILPVPLSLQLKLQVQSPLGQQAYYLLLIR